MEEPQGLEYRCRAQGRSDEALVIRVEQRGYIVQLRLIKQPEMEGLNEYSKVV